MKRPALTVVTALFNPRRFATRMRLYTDFRQMVERAGCRLVTVEAVFGDREPEVPAGPDVIHRRTTSELWHKERLLNIGIDYALATAPETRYIAWIDADVEFGNPHWVDDTVHALQHYKVVQMFGQAAFLDRADEILWKCDSAFRVFHQKGFHQEPPIPTDYIAGGHPGLAWAARVETLQRLEGLLDCCVGGSGDTHMAWALRGRWDARSVHDKPLSEGYLRCLLTWAKRCDLHVQENIGFVPGVCLHRWHGKANLRGYDKRWDILSFHQYDPHTDIVLSAEGLFEWTGNKPHLEFDLRLSSSSRSEDSIE